MKLFGTHHGSHEQHGRKAAPAPEPPEQETPEKQETPAEQPGAILPPEPPAWKETPEQARPKRRRTLWIVLAAVVLVLLAAVVVYALWERPPEIAPPTPIQSEAPTVTPSAAPSRSPTETPGPDETEEPTPTEELDPGEAPVVDMTGARKDGVYTILVAGQDKASGNTDTIMVVSFDTKNHKISVTNIPRDTIINIGWYSAPKRINSVYPGAIASGLDPALRMKQELRKMLGFDLDCYAIVNISAVERVVDTMGGIWFDVPPGMQYEDYVQDLYIDIPEGYQLLNGRQVVQICRFRQNNFSHTGYAGGDIQRIGVQHDMLKAIASQTLSMGNIPNFPHMLEIVAQEVNTDLTAANLAWFARQFLACKAEDITFQTMPIGASDLINGVSMVSVAPEAWLKMINETINPYEADVQLYNLSLLIATANNAYATNGVIAGGIDSFYCMSCTAAAGQAVAHAPGVHVYDDEGRRIGEEGPDNPSESDPPVESEQPVESETPVESEAPVESETPVETGTPAESETPVESQQPAETETPPEAEPPAETQAPAPAEPVGETGPEIVTAAPNDDPAEQF